MSLTGFYGDRFNLLMGVQADFDTENTADHVAIPVRSVTPTHGRERSEASLLGQGRFLPNKVHEGVISPALEIAVPVELRSIGWHLTGMFGPPTTTVGSPNDHAWAFNEASAEPNFYTCGLEYRDRAGTLAAVRYSKAVYNSLSFSFSRDSAPMAMNFGLLAARRVPDVATHDATPTTLTFGEELRNLQASVRVGADVDNQLTTIGVTAVDFTVSRNLQHNHLEIQNGDTAAGFIPGEVTSLSGSLGLVARANTLRALATTAAAVKLRFAMRNPSSAFSLIFTTDLALLDPFDWQADGLGMHTANVPFRIQQPGVDPPGTAATPLRINLLNDVANYAAFLPA